jgi:hypothetical protein
MFVEMNMVNYRFYLYDFIWYSFIWYGLTGFCYFIIHLLYFSSLESSYQYVFLIFYILVAWPLWFGTGLMVVLEGNYFTEDYFVFPTNTYPIVPVVTLFLILIIIYLFRQRRRQRRSPLNP